MFLMNIDDLRNLIKIISFADLMICSSTGPIHLADALDKKCIGIYLPQPMSSVKLWGVINKKSVNLRSIRRILQQSNCSEDKNTNAVSKTELSTERSFKTYYILNEFQRSENPEMQELYSGYKPCKPYYNCLEKGCALMKTPESRNGQ